MSGSTAPAIGHSRPDASSPELPLSPLSSSSLSRRCGGRIVYTCGGHRRLLGVFLVLALECIIIESVRERCARAAQAVPVLCRIDAQTVELHRIAIFVRAAGIYVPCRRKIEIEALGEPQQDRCVDVGEIEAVGSEITGLRHAEILDQRYFLLAPIESFVATFISRLFDSESDMDPACFSMAPEQGVGEIIVPRASGGGLRHRCIRMTRNIRRI